MREVDIGAYSAYAIAVENGFSGTEAEWLESLHGKSTYELAVDAGYTGTEEEWLAAVESARLSAEASATAAATSEANAKASEDTVTSSASAAAASEAAAEQSATLAAQYAAAASDSESAAAKSESNAKASEEAAQASAENAAESAAQAALSETNAKASESSASGYATAAATAATEAEESADSAADSASAANASESNAAASASAAAASAGNAATSESNAATSESNAAGSATAAAESASAASGSATDAAGSAAAAAASETAAAASEAAAETSATEASESATAAALSAQVAENFALLALSLLDGTEATYKSTMRRWFLGRGAETATSEELTALVDEWYTLTREDWCGWVDFYQPSVSAVSTGTKGGDNADLTCTPSTDTVEGQDDYAGLPLFACTDCNFIVDADTLKPVITAIDGITSNFVRTDPDVYVGVLQMSGYVFQREDTDTYRIGYSSTRNIDYSDIEPLDESINPDGMIRSWVVHGKYGAHKNDAGGLTCCSGVTTTAFISHNTLHTASKVNGSQYSGGTTADDFFCKLMAYIKYGSMTLDGIMQGCCNMNYQYVAQVTEEGVNRIILSTSNASNLAVGMTVLLGNYTTSTDRGTASIYSITGQNGALITAIESVTIDDTAYSAVYVDTADTFDTAANGSATEGTTYLSSFHWSTGTTDGVLGNDGSPISNTGGKYPYKIQGIECMYGAYNILADTILSLYVDDDGVYWYEPYVCRTSANQSTSITSNYAASGIKCQQPDAAAWIYIIRNSFRTGVSFPSEVGGTSSTYTRDGFYMNAANTGTREWLAWGALGYGSGVAGLSCVGGGDGLSGAGWGCAARLSPNGNRGEWVA